MGEQTEEKAAKVEGLEGEAAGKETDAGEKKKKEKGFKKAEKKVKGFFSDFGKFISKGNVLSMAIGVVIGVAFQAIVNSLVKDIITPLISLVIKMDLTEAKWVLVEATADAEAVTLNYGLFIQSVIDFLIIAFAIFIALKVATNLSKKFGETVELAKTKTRKRRKDKKGNIVEEEVTTEVVVLKEADTSAPSEAEKGTA